MHPNAPSPSSPGRRRALAAFVNTTVALIGGALSTLLGAFAVRPPRAAAAAGWIRAGSLLELSPNRPVPRVLSVPQVDGWYRERARRTVFLVWDGARGVRAMSATCTHLGCQVQWQPGEKAFVCPCHGGVYDAAGLVLHGPPPRPLDRLETRVDADGSVLVRV